MNQRCRRGLALALIAGTIGGGTARGDRPEYPPTRVEAVTDIVHGVSIQDPYRWLENGDSPEVQEWTREQNAFTRRCLDQFAGLRERLTERLTAIYRMTDVSSPRIYGQRLFHTRREDDQNHAVVYVKDSPDGKASVVLNPNEFSTDGTVALDWWYPSPDGSFVAYGKSSGGDEKSTLYVLDVESGMDLGIAIPHTRSCSLAWEPDGQGFFYTRFPIPGSVPEGDEDYFRHVYHHRLEKDWAQDPKVFGAGRPKEEWCRIEASGDGRHLILTAARGWSAQDLYLRRAGETEFRAVAVGLTALFRADVLGDKLYILTNYQAPRYHIVTTGLDELSPETWQEVLPQQKGILRDMQIVGGKLIVSILENAYSRLCAYEPDGKLSAEIELPTLGSVEGVRGRHDDTTVYFRFESFTHPPMIYQYHLGTHQLTVLESTKSPLETAGFTSRQIWFNSKDGTRVPMFVVHKKDLQLDGNNPAVIYGYGGFNHIVRPTFLQHPLPFIEAGGVYALVNLRGGGEFGEEWRRAGQLENKQNGFDDMIAACEKLISEGYTNPRRLAVRGGSNGGLLVGAVLTQRPDLLRAVHCAVPLLDMVRYHRFKIARLWIPEYGSAEDAEEFKYLHRYSPYHNVRRGVKYPAVLLTTADSDSRVDPMHARKMTALLQAVSGSDNPIMLWVEQKAGHGAGKPLQMKLAEFVDSWTFLMWQLGMIEPEDRMPASGAAETGVAREASAIHVGTVLGRGVEQVISPPRSRSGEGRFVEFADCE